MKKEQQYVNKVDTEKRKKRKFNTTSSVPVIKSLPHRYPAQIVAVVELFITSTLQFTLILLVFLSGTCMTFAVQGKTEQEFCSEEGSSAEEGFWSAVFPSSEYCSWCRMVYLPLTECTSTARLFIPWLITIGFLMLITLPCMASFALFKAAFTDQLMDDALSHCKSWNFVTVSYTIAAGTAVIYKIWLCDELSICLTLVIALRCLFLWIISKYTRNLREARLLSMWTLTLRRDLKSVGIY